MKQNEASKTIFVNRRVNAAFSLRLIGQTKNRPIKDSLFEL